MTTDYAAEQTAAVRAVLDEKASRILAVAGPGAGKTSLFKSLLQRLPQGDKTDRLAVTFINNLKNDLVASLGDLADARTFHGFCYALLRQRADLREPLSEHFLYFPKLPRLVAADWQHLRAEKPPQFLPELRSLVDSDRTRFFLERSEFYDAIGFDDSVVRAYHALSAVGASVPIYDLILVDEFQDFNPAEAAVIELLAARSKTVIVGDDDQALYGTLRAADERLIRGLHSSGRYANHTLPFCMRCTAAIVGATNDVIAAAESQGLLSGRIKKPFRPFPPVKGADSARYPHIKVVRTSVHNQLANYFGRYIEQQVGLLGPADIAQSHASGYPTALIIGSAPYLPEVQAYLGRRGLQVDARSAAVDPVGELSRDDAMPILAAHPASNLGWRIMLEFDRPELLATVLPQALKGHQSIAVLLPEGYRVDCLRQAEAWTAPEAEPRPTVDGTKPLIKFTSHEGSKGLSAHSVFILGLHDGGLPANSGRIRDIEVRKFLVAITRTRMQCHLLYSQRGRKGKDRQAASPFIHWIGATRKQVLDVNSDYWRH